MTKVVGVPVVVMWIHIMGGSIGGGSAGVGLEWGSGTCGEFPLYILERRCTVYLNCSPSSV